MMKLTTKSQIVFRRAGTKADQNYKKLMFIPYAQLAQNPMLAAVLIRRDYPCICCSCPQCDTVFMAAALKEEYHNDNYANRELLNDLANYASQGYNISVKNSNEFRLDYCTHLKK